MLFRWGAGVLKWPPDVTYDALMSDILDAYEGHIEDKYGPREASEATDGPKMIAATDDSVKAIFRAMAASKPTKRGAKA